MFKIDKKFRSKNFFKKLKNRLRRENFSLCKINLMEKYVMEQQFKLASAIKLKKEVLLKKISYELITSYQARCYAVYKILKTTGSKNFNVIYKKLKKNKQYRKLVDKLLYIISNLSLYKITLLRYYSSKKTTNKKKFIFIPIFLDKIIQNLYSFIIYPFVENNSDKFSYGLRPLRYPFNVTKTIFLLSKKHFYNFSKSFFVLSFDLIKCFSKIFNGWILNHLPIIPKNLFLQWLRLGFIQFDNINSSIFILEEKSFFTNVLSFLICNFLLNGIQNFVENAIKNMFNKKKKCVLIRFLNSIIIVSPSLDVLNLALVFVEDFIKDKGVCLNMRSKALIDLFFKKQRFLFLGFGFNFLLQHGKYNLKLFIPNERIKFLKKNVLYFCKKAINPYVLIKGSNFLVRKWSNYYKICNSKFSFIKLSAWLIKRISHALYFLYLKSNFEKGKYGIRKGRKSARIHRNIAAQVVKRLHFSKSNAINFFNYQLNNIKKLNIVFLNKTKRYVKLFLPKYLEIRKHHITSNKNYFDFLDYIDLRLSVFKHKSSLREYFLQKSKGFCPLCSRDLIFSRYKFYHLKPFLFGGNNKLFNLVPLCICCHNIIIFILTNNDVNFIKKFVFLDLLKLNFKGLQSKNRMREAV